MRTFQQSLAECLAHSAVFFSRAERWPFNSLAGEPRNDGKDTASTTQEETNEQVAAQGGSGTTTTAGAGGAGAGGVALDNARVGYQNGGIGNTDVTTIETSDPEVSIAALQSNDAVTEAALSVTGQVAAASIQAASADTQTNATFGEDALNAAAAAEANATTALEGTSAESQETANNALAAAENETLAGVTPAQEFQDVSATPGATSASKLSSLATILTIGVAAISIFYFLKKGRPA